MVTPVTTVRDYDWLMYQMQRLFSSGFFGSERFFFFFLSPDSGSKHGTEKGEIPVLCPSMHGCILAYSRLYKGELQIAPGSQNSGP